MKVLAAATAARTDRAASEVLHDEANARVVSFHLLPGQQVPPHRSSSTVFVQVIAGSGYFRGAESEAFLSAGGCAVFAPGEMHAVDAGLEALRFLAVIAPRPGG